jgi:hypothetical protein
LDETKKRETNMDTTASNAGLGIPMLGVLAVLMMTTWMVFH